MYSVVWGFYYVLQLFYTLYCEDAFRENQFQYKATTASSIKEIIFYDLMHLKMKTIFSYMDLITLMSLNVLRLSASLN